MNQTRFAIIAIAVGLLVTAGAIGLLEPTETRYAEIAREMNASGDYLTPRLNGIAHFHKPPLAYWMTAAGLRVAGNAWGARLATALACILTLIFTARIATRFGASPGLTVWILGSCMGVFIGGRALASDPFLMATVAAFWAFAPGPGAWIALGLAFLTKGPVALVLTVAPVLVAAAWARDRTLLVRIASPRGWLIAAVIGITWYAVMAMRTPGLAGYWLGFQVLDRVATTAHDRPGPIWYFAPVLLAGLLPWTALLIAGLGHAWRRRGEPGIRLILCWLIVPFVVFSLSGSKLPGYLLPVFPAAALISGLAVRERAGAAQRVTALLLASLALANWIAGPRGLGQLIGLANEQVAALPAFAHLFSVTVLYAAYRVWQGGLAIPALLVALAWSAAAGTLAPYDRMLGSPRATVELLAQQRGAGEPVVLHARFHAGLPFYLGETVLLLEVPRETMFDGADRLAGVVITREELKTMLSDGKRAWLFAPEGASVDLARSLGLDYVAIARDRKGTLGILTAPR